VEGGGVGAHQGGDAQGLEVVAPSRAAVVMLVDTSANEAELVHGAREEMTRVCARHDVVDELRGDR
jgi:hypothetical protein